MLAVARALNAECTVFPSVPFPLCAEHERLKAQIKTADIFPQLPMMKSNATGLLLFLFYQAAWAHVWH